MIDEFDLNNDGIIDEREFLQIMQKGAEGDIDF